MGCGSSIDARKDVVPVSSISGSKENQDSGNPFSVNVNNKPGDTAGVKIKVSQKNAAVAQNNPETTGLNQQPKEGNQVQSTKIETQPQNSVQGQTQSQEREVTSTEKFVPSDQKSVEVKPSPEDNEDLNLGEQHPGLIFLVGVISKKNKKVSVNAGAAKVDLANTEKLLRANNAYLNQIQISFDPDETSNVDWFISKIFETAPYRKINIAFEKQATFTKEGLTAFGQSLAKLSLEVFVFENWGPDADDLFFSSVKPGIKGQKGLKNLNFAVYNASKITNATFEHIKEMIQDNKGLEDFALTFNDSQSITSQALALIKEPLKSNKSLKTLYLSFTTCQKLTDEFLTHMTEIVKALPALESLRLFVQGVQFSTQAFESFSTLAQGLKLKECIIQK